MDKPVRKKRPRIKVDKVKIGTIKPLQIEQSPPPREPKKT